MRLTKGFEVELFAGTPQGVPVGLADQIVAALPGFVWEPDRRNVEYTTAPNTCYERLLCDLLRPRLALRRYLRTLGDLTLLPGSTLALGGSDHFERSDPGNPYHTYIEQTYGTRVVTASVHINVGIEDPEALIRACRVVRVEAALFLALSAASPFLNGQVMGVHSQRWHQFPQTPAHIPLFTSHAHYCRWTEVQLAAGTMQNVRHLWGAVRPNGHRRPYDLNRLELRICELVSDPVALLAITALLEARLLQVLADPDLDPLRQSRAPAPYRADWLRELADTNGRAAAAHSLEAHLRHWEDGRPIRARDWIAELYDQVAPVARAHGFYCFLSPLQTILRDGNEAQQWLAQISAGRSCTEVITDAIAQMAHREQELEDKICGLVGVTA